MIKKCLFQKYGGRWIPWILLELRRILIDLRRKRIMTISLNSEKYLIKFNTHCIFYSTNMHWASALLIALRMQEWKRSWCQPNSHSSGEKQSINKQVKRQARTSIYFQDSIICAWISLIWWTYLGPKASILFPWIRKH